MFHYTRVHLVSIFNFKLFLCFRGFIKKSVFINSKELSFCHKCRIPLIFQTMNHIRPHNLSLKYPRFTTSGCKDIGIIKIQFVAKTQFLCSILTIHNPSLGSCELPHKNLGPIDSVVFTRAYRLQTNNQIDKQSILRTKDLRLKVRWKLNLNRGKLRKPDINIKTKKKSSRVLQLISKTHLISMLEDRELFFDHFTTVC